MIRKLKTERLIFLICILICLLALVISTEAYERKLTKLEYQNMKQAAQLKDKQEQIEILEIIIENQKTEPEVIDEPEYIGTFTVTHYCPCEICCGKTDGITFTGTQATEGRTVAVDPEVIPLGSTVIIGDQEYIAEDVGGAIKGNRIDKFMSDHNAALQAGIVQAEVWIGGPYCLP